MKTLSVNCSTCGKDFQKPVYYIKQGQKRGYPNHFCSTKCSSIFARTKNQKLKQERIEEYNKNPKLCLHCRSIIPYKDKSWKRYCSGKCSAIFTQKDGGHRHWSDEDKKRVSDSLINYYKNNPNCKKNCSFPDRKIKRIECECKFCKKKFEKLPSSKKVSCSQKCYFNSIKNGYLKGKSGGYRGCGGDVNKGKQGWYKGYYCQSTWELAWIIYQLEHNILFKRNTEGFEYSLNGKKHKYYPDFILDDGNYIEIKGWDNGSVSSKLEQFPHKIIVLRKEEMKPYLQYAKIKYGKSLEKLYENVSG